MEEQIKECLEKINYDFLLLSRLESKEFKIGRRFLDFKSAFPFHMIKYFTEKKSNSKKKKVLKSISKPLQIDKIKNYSPLPVNDKKGVVYTCVTNNYDVPKSIFLKDECIDYIAYLDRTGRDIISDWDCKPLPTLPIDAKGNNINRYMKFHPYSLFENDYDYAIYIDGNVQLVSDITGLYRIAQGSPLGIAMHLHSERDCVYNEAIWCKINRRGNIKKIEEVLSKMKTEGFPEHFGLFEATIIVVDLHNQVGKQILELWWEEFIKSECGRDQILFPYVLWKNNYDLHSVGVLGNNEYFNPKFRIFSHKGKVF